MENGIKKREYPNYNNYNLSNKKVCFNEEKDTNINENNEVKLENVVNRSKQKNKGKKYTKAERMAKKALRENSLMKLSYNDFNNINSIKYKLEDYPEFFNLINSNVAENWEKAFFMVLHCNDSQKTLYFMVKFIMQLILNNHSKAASHFTLKFNIDSVNLKNFIIYLYNQFNIDPHNKMKLIFIGYIKLLSIKNSIEDTFVYKDFILPELKTNYIPLLSKLLHDNDNLKLMTLKYIIHHSRNLHLINQLITSLKIITVPHSFKENNKFHHYMVNLIVNSQVNNNTFYLKTNQIKNKIETTILMLWMNAKVLLFGSTVTGLSLPNDDIDITIIIPSISIHSTNDKIISLLYDLKGHLQIYSSSYLSDFFVISNARIPILVLTDIETKLKVEISINNYFPLYNTCLIKKYLDYQESMKFESFDMNENANELGVVRITFLILKHWMKSRNILISSYSLIILLIHYLQIQQILPVIDIPKVLIPDIDNDSQSKKLLNKIVTIEIESIASFVGREFQRWIYGNETKRNSSLPIDLIDLIFGFFRYLSIDFNYSQEIISIRYLKLLKENKQIESFQRKNIQNPMTNEAQKKRKPIRKILMIEDPIEIDRNISIGKISKQNDKNFQLELIRAFLLFYNNDSMEPEQFLEELMTEKPQVS